MRRVLLWLACLVLPAVALADASPAVYVESVQSQWPADLAGLRAGDAVKSFALASRTGAGQPVGSIWEFLALRFQREGQSALVLRTLRGEEPQEAALGAVRWGAEFHPALSPQESRLLREKRFDEIAAGAESRRDASLAAWAWMRAAEAAYLARDAPRTEQFTRSAQAALERGKLEVFEPVLWQRRARIAWLRWDSQTARESSARARALLAAKAKDVRALAAVTVGEGDAALQARDLEAARKAYETALEYLEHADPHAQLRAEARFGLAGIALERRELPLVTEHMTAARAACGLGCRNTTFYSDLLNREGALKSLLGQDKEAFDEWKAALELAQRLAPDSLSEARQLTGAGLAEWRSGRLAEAETYMRRALAIVQRDAPGSILEAGVLQNLGIVHHLRFDYEAARRAYERSAEIFAGVSPRSAETQRALTNVALAAGLAGDPQGALEVLSRVLALQLETKAGGSDLAYTYHAMALNHERLKRWSEAEANYRRAIELRRELGIGGITLVNTQQSLANVLRLAGTRLDEATALFREALELHDRLFPESYARAEALYGLGTIARTQGRLREAADHLGRAVDVIDAQEQLIGGAQEVRSSYAARFAHFYKEYMEVLLELGREREAFESLERYRARVFRAMLAERSAILDSALPAKLRAERDRIGKALESTNSALQRVRDPDAESARIEELLARLASLYDERKALYASIREAAPGLAAVRYPRAYEFDDRVELLEPGTALLSYAVTPQAVHVFVLEPVSGKGATRTRLWSTKLAITGDALEEQIEQWRVLMKASLEVDESRVALAARSRALYGALVEPLRARLSPYRRWLVVSDGPLHFLPFAAVVTQTGPGRPRYLVEDVSLSHVLAVSLLDRGSGAPRERRAEFEIVAYADPLSGAETAGIAVPVLRGPSLGPLPWSREEANAVRGLFGPKAKLHVGSEVTEQTVLAEAPRARRVHFATHAVLDPRSPLDSYLVLAQPSAAGGGGAASHGRLRAAEIFERLDLQADLVALSACATADGQESAGEGLMGLTRAFHFAGARQVLSSLWPVWDRSTSRLMVQFYRHLLDGKPAAEALRAAQIAMLSGRGDESHPFHWAAFQLSTAGAGSHR